MHGHLTVDKGCSLKFAKEQGLFTQTSKTSLGQIHCATVRHIFVQWDAFEKNFLFLDLTVSKVREMFTRVRKEKTVASADGVD